jgi:tetratricopeptide (TPR) repeat protein
MEKVANPLASAPRLAAFIERQLWVVALGLGLLAFFIRVWHLTETEANDPFFYSPVVDPQIYHEWAIRISRGEFDRESVFFLSPLYPYFLGFLYWIADPGMIFPRVVQIALGALTVVGVFLLGRRVFDPVTGFVAGLIYALYAPAIFYEPLYLVTAIQTPLNVALVMALLAAFSKPDRSIAWLSCGMLLGLSALARPNILMFGGFVIAGLLLQVTHLPEWRQALTRGLVFAIGVGLIVFPVTIRNYVVEKDIVLVTSTGGLNFYIGNNAAAKGRFQSPPIFGKTEVSSPRAQLKAYTKFAEAETGRSLSPSEAADFWYSKTWSEIGASPGRWGRLLILKLSLFFNYYEVGNSRHFHHSVQYSRVLQLPLIRFGLLAPFALLGIVVASRRWREALMLYGMVAVYIITVLMFFFLAHYRMPVTPFLAIFAAYGLVRTIDVGRRRRWPQLGLAAWILIGSAMWVHLNLTNPAYEVPNIHYNLGNVYAEKERYDDAIREFKKSIELNPAFMSRHHNLAYVYGLRPETYPEAIEAWQTVLEMGLEKQDEYAIRASRQEIARLRKALGQSE